MTVPDPRHALTEPALIIYAAPDRHPGGEPVPHYISLIKWTDEGLRNVRESPKRADAAEQLAKQTGGKTQLFYTMGEYDLVALTEAPNDEAAMQILLQLGSMGNVRTTTMKAWTPADAAKIVAKLK